MKSITFYHGHVETWIILRWEGNIKNVVNLHTLELRDIERGISLPIIIFQ